MPFVCYVDKIISLEVQWWPKTPNWKLETLSLCCHRIEVIAIFFSSSCSNTVVTPRWELCAQEFYLPQKLIGIGECEQPTYSSSSSSSSSSSVNKMAFTASDCERCCSLRRFATFQFGKYHRALARMKFFEKIFGSSGSAPYRYDEGDEYPSYNGPRQSSGPWNGPVIFEVAFHHCQIFFWWHDLYDNLLSVMISLAASLFRFGLETGVIQMVSKDDVCGNLETG